MGIWFASWWMKCLLLMLFIQQHKSHTFNASKKFEIVVSVIKLMANYTENGTKCDPGSNSSSGYCDVGVRLKLLCRDCNENITATYPNKSSCYRDAQWLSEEDFNVTKPLIVYSNSDVAELDILVIDLDSKCRGKTRKLFHNHSEMHIESFTRSKRALLTVKYGYGKVILQAKVKCLADVCGGKCVVLDRNVRCVKDVVMCTYGKYSLQCNEYRGYSVWNINLLRFQTNYSALNLTSSCFEEVTACFLIDNNGCNRTRSIGWNNFDKPVNSLILESDLPHLSSTFSLKEAKNRSSIVAQFNLVTVCNGKKISTKSYQSKITYYRSRVFKFRSSGRILFGVITSCNSDFESTQCKHATNYFINSKPENCYDYAHSSACAFEKLCGDKTMCENGGTCMLRRSVVNVDAYKNGQLLDENEDENLEDYSAGCECSDEYYGSRCELKKLKKDLPSKGYFLT